MKRWQIGLPMYQACVPAAHRQLQQQILAGLRDAGWSAPVDLLDSVPKLEAFWRSDTLLLGQACGYPLMTSLAGQVRLVGTPRYRLAGCEDYRYCSFLIVRQNSDALSLADLRGSRAVFNQPHSQSGMNALRHAIAPLAQHGQFFSSVTASGAHRASMQMVADGLADLAAVDCVTWGYLAIHAPEAVAGLRILGRTAPMPGLPLIASPSLDDQSAILLRQVLDSVLASRWASQHLQLAGLAPTRIDDYRPLLESLQACAGIYPVLA